MSATLKATDSAVTETRNTTCYMCACRCGIRVTLKNGEVRYIEGNPDHPLNKGVICAKGASGIMKQYSPARLTQPLRRKSGAERGAAEFEPVSDPDLMIYAGGFFDDNDKKLMNAVHDTDPQALGAQSWNFTDKRLPEMLFRYRARSYPETLDAEEQARWLAHCRDRLIEGESGYFTFEAFYAEIEQLRSEMEADAPKMKLLDEVAAFGPELESFLKGDVRAAHNR